MPQHLNWLCEYCQLPIKDGAGYLYVRHKQIQRYVQARTEWKRHNPGPIITASTIEQLPPRPRWITTHRDCDPEPYAADYWIPIRKVRTHRDVIGLTAHLLGKTWITNTNWEQFLRKAQEVEPS